MFVKINPDRTVEIVKKVPKNYNPETYKEVDSLPQSLYGKYKLNENNEIVVDTEKELLIHKTKSIMYLLQMYQQYLFSKENILRIVGFTSLITRILVVLNTNKSLTDDQVTTLSQIMEESDSIFKWITQVTNYQVSIEDSIKSAESIDEINSILNSINFSQFDESYPNVTIADKLNYLANITLEG